MKTKMVCLLIGLAVCSPALLRAEEAKSQNRPSREELREKWKNLSPEEREAKIKEWREKNPNAPGAQGGDKFREQRQEMARQLGLDPEEMKNLKPEERFAKFREAAEAKGAELKKKKEAGTITPEEQKLLDRLAEMKKRGEEFRRRGGLGGPGGPPQRDGKKDGAEKK